MLVIDAWNIGDKLGRLENRYDNVVKIQVKDKSAYVCFDNSEVTTSKSFFNANRNIGIIRISNDFIKGEEAKEILKHVWVLESRLDFYTDSTLFKCCCDGFDRVGKGEAYPEYEVTMERDGMVTFKKK